MNIYNLIPRYQYIPPVFMYRHKYNIEDDQNSVTEEKQQYQQNTFDVERKRTINRFAERILNSEKSAKILIESYGNTAFDHLRKTVPPVKCEYKYKIVEATDDFSQKKLLITRFGRYHDDIDDLITSVWIDGYEYIPNHTPSFEQFLAMQHQVIFYDKEGNLLNNGEFFEFKFGNYIKMIRNNDVSQYKINDNNIYNDFCNKVLSFIYKNTDYNSGDFRPSRRIRRINDDERVYDFLLDIYENITDYIINEDEFYNYNDIISVYIYYLKNPQKNLIDSYKSVFKEKEGFPERTVSDLATKSMRQLKEFSENEKIVFVSPDEFRMHHRKTKLDEEAIREIINKQIDLYGNI